MKPRVKVYVSMETGECHVSYIYRYAISEKEWFKLFYSGIKEINL